MSYHLGLGLERNSTSWHNKDSRCFKFPHVDKKIIQVSSKHSLKTDA